MKNNDRQAKPRGCPNCGSAELDVRRENYKYDACGLNNVTLGNVEVRHCRTCGHREAMIPAVSSLHHLLAMTLAKKEERLSAAEIRFLRKYLGLSSVDFAEKLGVDKSTVSRYESAADPQMMSKPIERYLRLMVMCEKPVNEYPLEDLAVREHQESSRLTVVAKADGWAVAVA